MPFGHNKIDGDFVEFISISFLRHRVEALLPADVMMCPFSQKRGKTRSHLRLFGAQVFFYQLDNMFSRLLLRFYPLLLLVLKALIETLLFVVFIFKDHIEILSFILICSQGTYCNFILHCYSFSKLQL